MATRRESVVLELDDRFTPGIVKAAAAAGLFQRELDKLDGTSLRSGKSLGSAERSVVSFDRTTRDATPTIDKLSGRLELFARGFAALGPASVPIAAVAIPAVTALTTELGFAAAGAGTLMLAFHGVGDALTKLNKAALEPTATNIAAADAALSKLGPDAGAFVVQLHNMVPLAERLQRAAGSGLFPGLSESLKLFAEKAPLAERILRNIGSELGNLSREGAQSLTGKDWAPFFRMIEHDAPGALHDMAHAAGDVAHGLSQILIAFEPMNRDMVSGLADMARSFDNWASGLKDSDGFEGFVEYLRQNGPVVLDTLGTIAKTFTDLIVAAAPLGGPTLKALDDLAHVLDTIASSPLATPLIALIQALSIAKLTMSGWGKITDSTFGARAVGGLKSYTAGLLEITSAEDRARLSATELQRVEAQRSAAQRSALLKGGLAIAGFAAVSTGVTDKIGATNTAMDAMAGAMIGGAPGAAVGGLIGAVQDYNSAAQSATAITDKLNQAFSSSSINIKEQSQALDQAQSDRDAMLKKHQSIGYDLTHPFESINGAVAGLDGTTIDEETNQQIEKQRVAFSAQSTMLSQIGMQMGATFRDSVGRDVVPTFAQLQQVVDRATPALQHFGYTWSSLQDLAQSSPDQYQRVVEQIVNFTKQSDSAAGRSKAVSDALRGLSNEMNSTADQADALQQAMDNLFSPKMNLNAARNAWLEGLRGLKGSLSDAGREILGTSNAALQNQDAIRGLAGQMKDYLSAQAQAGKPAKEIISTYKQQRQALIDTAGQLGINKKALEIYLRQIGFTPKAISTDFHLNGIDKGVGDLRNLKSQLEGLAGRVFSTTLKVTREGPALDSTGGRTLVAPAGADGMEVPGPRHPYGDKVLIFAAPGEQVVTNRHGEADHLRATGRLPGFADGGAVGGGRNGGDPLTNAMHGLQHSLDHNSKAIDKDRQARQDLVSKEQSIIQTVQEAFRSDLFAATPGVWAANGGFNPIAALRSDIGDARQFNRSLHDLRRRGLSGGAFSAVAQSGNVEDAQMLTDYSGRQLREFEQLFRRRQRLSHAVGQFAGDTLYGAQIDSLSRQLKAANAHQKAMQNHLKSIDHELKHRQADKQAQATKKALDSTASNADRRVKR